MLATDRAAVLVRISAPAACACAIIAAIAGSTAMKPPSGWNTPT